MNIIRYEESLCSKWDEFVRKEAVNGTFLQTRKFLSYHPAERFVDCSFLVENKGNIVAVCPACINISDGRKEVISHGGSTYGGLLVAADAYKTEKLIEIIDLAETFLGDIGINKITYKVTPDIYCKIPSDLMRFCLEHAGYKQKTELNFYIDYNDYKQEIIRNFNNNRKRCVKAASRAGMYAQKINTEEEIREFYVLLCHTLQKYGKKPVHTYEELLLLGSMFQKEIEFIGIYLEKQMVAGTMLFFFEQTQCVHTQYLATDPLMVKLNPMSYLYYAVIEYAKECKCRCLSWGIATDHEGNLNMGLILAKESVGSRHGINYIYEKEL